MRKIIRITFVLMALMSLSPYVFGAVIEDAASVEGTVTRIQGEIIYLKNSRGREFKLRRAWVEKKHKNFQPGQFMEVDVSFEDYLRLNSRQ
jgi:hypothetical protein